MSYRSNYEPSKDSISDVFDSAAYQVTCQKKVMVDGQELGHKYFQDSWDIAFSFCIDSYLLFKNRGGPSATPLLLKNFNLDPSIRTHLKHLLCIGVIPGPRLPKDLGSFLAPFEEECISLAYGVRTYDARSDMLFDLHA